MRKGPSEISGLWARKCDRKILGLRFIDNATAGQNSVPMYIVDSGAAVQERTASPTSHYAMERKCSAV